MPPKAPTSAPKVRKKRKSRAADTSDVEVISERKPREVVNWLKNPAWTDDLIAYLSENPLFRIKLFSDSTAEAKQAGRKKLVGKDGKPQQYAVLAEYVFKNSPGPEQARYASNPGKYATAVETRLRRLKTEYKAYVEILGATGAGLDPEQVTVGSKIESLIGDIRSKWPWWDDLHAFWRELPNYNPIGVQSSEPGTDHAAEAEALFDNGAGTSNVDEDHDEEDGRSATSRARDEDDGGDYKSHESDPDEDSDDLDATPATVRSTSPTPPPNVEIPVMKTASVPKSTKPKPVVGGRDLGLTKAHDPSSSLASASGAATAKLKKPLTAIDRMNNLRETESVRLAQKRKMQHEEEMARIKVKRMKVELRLLQAQNERKRLNNHAWSTPASPRASPRRARTVVFKSIRQPVHIRKLQTSHKITRKWPKKSNFASAPPACEAAPRHSHKVPIVTAMEVNRLEGG
ncbi:hypothetical protein GGX14DRAFT_407338 [Mycena pura]|uniref:Uncharacterized protein n=1 Tax=Mycena pura TaxID=153505 RepID=A0AAD6UNL7_9AGAR|nr:hypothetical protein GGX14DRAFT_407338 [Mycena pura]